MTLHCDVVEATAAATDSLAGELFISLLDTAAQVAAVVLFTSVVSVYDGGSAAASDSVVSESAYSFTEEPAVATSSFQTIEITGTSYSQAKAKSSLVMIAFEGLITESASVSDLVIENTSSTVIESVSASSTIFANKEVTTLYESSALARDSVPYPSGATLIDETAAVSSSVTPVVITKSYIYESVLAESDITADWSTDTNILTSTASATSVVSSKAVAYKLTVETIDADSEVTQGGMQQVWSASTDTMGMTRWDTQIKALAVSNGSWLGILDGDVVKLDWDMSYTNGVDLDIASVIRTGLNDFGSQSMKHASYFRASYITEDTLSAKISNTGSGNEVGFSYPLEARTANALVSSRAKLGRGARSRYWRVEINNTAKPFELRDAWLEIDSLTRKV